MMIYNHTSRYHVAAAAVQAAAAKNEKVAIVAHEKATEFMHLAQKTTEYALANGKGESNSNSMWQLY